MKQDLDERLKKTIQNIDARPHYKYIRYLLSKRYPISTIKQELYRLGLSSPGEPSISAYYLIYMDNLIKMYGLSDLYSDYKNKILRKRSVVVDKVPQHKLLLSYRLQVHSLEPCVHTAFCKFVKHLEIDDLWASEIAKCYASDDDMPVNEEGKRIITCRPNRFVEKVLVHDKRYLIDKMILENVPEQKIAEYFRAKYKDNILGQDIEFYKKTFFTIKTNTIEGKIRTLEVEKSSLTNLLKDMESVSYDHLEMGEKNLLRRQAVQRVEELTDNIKTLNMLYSDYAHKYGVIEKDSFEGLFTDVLARGYKRFCDMDVHKDRDVVDSLAKLARIMTSSYDKLESIKSMGGTDAHSQAMLLDLYKKRTEEIMEEQINHANDNLKKAGMEPMEDIISPDDIAGIEELGMSFEVEEDDD